MVKGGARSPSPGSSAKMPPGASRGKDALSALSESDSTSSPGTPSFLSISPVTSG